MRRNTRTSRMTVWTVLAAGAVLALSMAATAAARPVDASAARPADHRPPTVADPPRAADRADRPALTVADPPVAADRADPTAEPVGVVGSVPRPQPTAASGARHVRPVPAAGSNASDSPWSPATVGALVLVAGLVLTGALVARSRRAHPLPS